MTSPWLDPNVAQQQRALVDAQLQQSPPPPHFTALVNAVKATQCPGEILEVGPGVGHGREVLCRAGFEYRSYTGIDISPEACRIAKERYPESRWLCGYLTDGGVASYQDVVHTSELIRADVVVDGSCLLHADDWKAHLRALCKASRRWVILHRVPIAESAIETVRTETSGYGHTFPAWRFGSTNLLAEMQLHGFTIQGMHDADGDSVTLVFAKARQFVSYCDRNYLSRLKALHASMVRHCGPFKLHVLAWDYAVAAWCIDEKIDYTHVEDLTATRTDLWRDKLPGPTRTKVEYMWTLGPAYLAATMEKTGEPCTYVDADVLFHSSPEPVFAEIGSAPAAVVPHGFALKECGLPGPTAETHNVFGRYNVGIVYAADRAFVQRWAEQCREWCYDRLERTMIVDVDDMWTPAGIKYGDQKYLEDWAAAGAHVVQYPGACAGPWAAHTRSLDIRDGVIHFGNRPLVAWHYSAYREGPHGQVQLSRPEYALTERQAEILYRPYCAALRETKCSK